MSRKTSWNTSSSRHSDTSRSRQSDTSSSRQLKTSLSRQLDRLKLPQGSSVKETKGKVSFLYDFNEAKGIDSDTHFAIALNGLQALCQQDPSIERYRDTLFNESSKSLEREMLSIQVNEDLDEKIEDFLLNVISPYFLLSCSHKTLEWLIHKFSIHEYNADILIASVLPYHETRLFARLIQICSAPKKPNSQWFWLKSIQLAGVPLPKPVLINHCIADLGFFRFIGDTLVTSLELQPAKSVFTPFFVSTAVNVIRQDPNEKMISLVMEFVVKGIKSNNEQFMRASYCILSFICTQVTLENKMILKILGSMSRRFTPTLSEDLLILLSIVANNQKLEYLPAEITVCFNVKEVAKMSQNNNISALIRLALKGLIIESEDDLIYERLFQFINQLSFDSLAVDACIKTISQQSVEENKGLRKKFSVILTKIERRYPSLFDESLIRLDSFETVSQLIGSFRYSLVKECNLPLLLCLNHETEAVRVIALNHVINNFDMILSQNDKESLTLLRNKFVNELNLEDPHILLSIFSLKEKLFDLFSDEEMFKICTKILNASDIKEEELENDSSTWFQLKNSILSVVCSKTYQNEEALIKLIFCYLLPLKDADLDTVEIILNSKSAKTSKILNSMRKKYNSFVEKNGEKEILLVISILFQEVANHCIEKNDINIINFVEESKKNIRSLISSIILLERIIFQSKNWEMKQKTGDVLLNLMEMIMKNRINKKKLNPVTFEHFINNCLKSISKKRIDLNVIYYSINSMIESIDAPNINDDNNTWFWHKQIYLKNFFNRLFIFLFDYSFANNIKIASVFRTLISYFITKVVSKIGINFFSAQWSCLFSPLLQSRSLAIFCNLDKKYLSQINNNDIQSLMIAMRSSSPKVRQFSIDVLKILCENSNHELLLPVVESSETIKNDEFCISSIISKWFTSNDPKYETFKNECIKNFNDETTPAHIKLGLLLLMNRTNHRIFNQLLFTFNSILEKDESNLTHYNTCEAMISFYSDPHLLSAVVSEDDPILEFFIKALHHKNCRNFAINVLDKELFESVSSNVAKLNILKQLILVIVNENEKEAKRKVKKLFFDGNLISSLLTCLVPLNGDQNLLKSSKRRRTIGQIEFSLETNEWKMFLIILELIEAKNEIKNCSNLMKNLLEYLKMTFRMTAKSSFEYFRQLLMSSIINCLKQKDTDIKSLQIESIIECLRESHQRETQRVALMLICNVADSFKNEILDNMMTIFTFIGTNMLQCDDQYTMQVILDTMDAIIPKLLNESEEMKDSLLNIFVESLPNIPAHRRLQLFQRLLSMLQEKNYLWIMLLKIVEKSIPKIKIEKHHYFDLAVALCCNCDIVIQLDIINKLLTVLSTDYMEERTPYNKRRSRINENDAKIFAQSLSQLILATISSHEFVEVTATTKWDLISEPFERFLQTLLLLIEKCSKNANDTQGKSSHFSRLRNVFYQILQKINHLLPIQQMIDILLGLLGHKSILIQRKALEMINEELQDLRADSFNKNQILSLTSALIRLIPDPETVCKLDDAGIYNSQLSLISLKLISKYFKEDDEQLAQILAKLIALFDGMKGQFAINFTASAILCMTQLIVAMSVHAIPLFPTVMPIILANFKSSDEVILISNLTAISKITQHFPQFLSPHLDQILKNTCIISHKDTQNINLNEKLNNLFINFAKLVPKRVLINSIDSSYNEISLVSSDALCQLMFLLKLTLENMNKTEIEGVLKILTKIMLKSMDYRNINHNASPADDIQKVENSCNSVFSAFIPKLSENSFRPLVYKLYDWGIRVRNGKLYQRVITFYKLMDVLADKLESLFCVLVAPTLVKNCSQMLTFFSSTNEETNTDLKTAQNIICLILATLSKCFLYDSNTSFLNKERVQTLMKPIIDQISNTLGEESHYDERINNGICLCVQYLIQSVKDDIILKDINYQILIKTRDTNSKVRWGALKTLHALILAANEEYLSLIPETMPFIAELSEDDSPHVELVFRSVVNDLEQILGEPISKYL